MEKYINLAIYRQFLTRFYSLKHFFWVLRIWFHITILVLKLHKSKYVFNSSVFFSIVLLYLYFLNKYKPLLFIVFQQI